MQDSMVCLQVDQLVAACAELAKMTSNTEDQQCLPDVDQPGEHDVEEAAAAGDSDDGLDLYGDLQQADTGTAAHHLSAADMPVLIIYMLP